MFAGLTLIGGLFVGSASAQDASRSALDRVREEKALYTQQQGQLAADQAGSEDDLKLIEADAKKQRAVIIESLRKLEEINTKLVLLKDQRGRAMEESYVSSTGESTLLYALVDSGSLSEFLRRGQYTIFLIDRKESLVERIDGEIKGLDDQRRDLVTKQNALENRIKELNDKVALIKLQLKTNAKNLAEATDRESYLASITDFLDENGRDFVKRNEPIGGRFAFGGGGTEHGLGMSQYGAKGAAQEGRDFNEILSHYYQGSGMKNVGSFQTNQGESEKYLVGVVEAEMSSSWPMEALKAQAVAARSYAYMNRDRLDNTPRTQAWVGPSLQTERARRAVRETRGQVLTSGGSVIAAYFHSTSGGWTENNENVWGGSPLPWLRGVSSPWETDSPHWYWETNAYSRSAMQAILSRDSRTAVGQLKTIQIVGRGVSGRVTAVKVVGSSGTKTVSGPRFKTIFNAYSPSSEPGLTSTLFGFR